jgi:hypothetical protein
MDQAGIQLLRATGRGQLMQVVWIYEHPVDFEALKRFHRNFGYSTGADGSSGRRCRLVDIAGSPHSGHRESSSSRRPSSFEVSDWADEQARAVYRNSPAVTSVFF